MCNILMIIDNKIRVHTNIQRAFEFIQRASAHVQQLHTLHNACNYTPSLPPNTTM